MDPAENELEVGAAQGADADTEAGPAVVDQEAALIRKIERRIELPDDLKREVGRWEDLRQYVHTTAMLLDDDEAVGTNFIYRNQGALMTLIAPKDPAPRVLPREMIPASDASAGSGNPLLDLMNPMAPGRLPLDISSEHVGYAKTHELLLERQQARSGLVDIIEGAAQDAITLPIAWVKMRLQEDFTLDPVGYGRNNDQLDTLKRFERLRRDYDDGRFTDRSPEFEELSTLNSTIRAFVLDALQARMEDAQQLLLDEAGQPVLDDQDEPVYTGAEDIQEQISAIMEDPSVLVEVSELPEVAHYIGYTFQQVDPEDIRWDWNIRRPEDLRYARWMAHRAWMTEADIKEKWGVTSDDLRTAARFSQDGYEVTMKDSADSDPEYGGKDPEEWSRGSGTASEDDDTRRGETLAVWEYWDRVQGRVFRFVQGTGKLLDKYVPTALPSRFYPFFPISYNRVTGRFLGICDTDMQAPLQDESNRQRTWKREAQKSAHPRWMIAKGLLRPGEKQRFEEALPYSLTEAERAEDLAKSIFPIIPPDYNPALYDRTDTILEMQQMAGIPAAALGAGNAGMTATSDSIANQQMGNQTGRRREALKKVYREIYQAMMEINAQVLPAANVTEIVGAGAVWPEFDRQSILSNFIVEVEATLDSVQERGNELKAWLDFTTIAQAMGLPLDPIPVAKKLLQLMGLRVNLGSYISIPALMAMLGAGQAPGPAGAGGGKQPNAAPRDQGGFGAAGGAPAGKGFSAPPAGPESIPGPKGG